MISNLPLDLDTIINKNTSYNLIKHDISTTVGILKGDAFGLPHNLLVKRFNNRGFFDFIIRKIIGSRAKRLWSISSVLYKKDLPVPRPVTFIEPSLRQKNSFYLSTVMDNSSDLSTIYKKGMFHQDRNLVPRLAKTIARWHLAGAVHGDLKWPNILMQKNESEYTFLLIDLDQSKMYSSPSIKGIVKDLKRFYRFGLELGAETWVKKEFFPEYFNHVPEEIKNKIDLHAIQRNAYREWIKKGQKRY
jgi:tRNA A-37 threonylcarbamoyl transferase component Bud32